MNIADDVKVAYDAGEWYMFARITGVYHGKQYYFLQEDGMVYSRHSCKYMSREEAYQEFLTMIGF